MSQEKPEVLKRVLAQARKPLIEAAIVNSIRTSLCDVLKNTGLPVEYADGGLTKYNRTERKLPKEHCIDAACVGESTPERLVFKTNAVWVIKAEGRGLHQRTKPDKYGFPRLQFTRNKRFFGFQTGDIAQAEIPKGKYKGRHTGVVAVRAKGTFVLDTGAGKAEGSYKHFRLMQRADGYSYAVKGIEGLGTEDNQNRRTPHSPSAYAPPSGVIGSIEAEVPCGIF